MRLSVQRTNYLFYISLNLKLTRLEVMKPPYIEPISHARLLVRVDASE
jgi:hypothetical protein